MIKKPVIVIMTSKDEFDGVSHKLAEAIQKYGSQNVVVIGDDKYGSAGKLSTLDRLMDTGQEYQYLLERKDRGVMRDKLKRRKFSKRIRRIINMLKRFHPEYLLCVTPYAHHCAVEAKRRAKLKIPVLYLMQTFTAPKRGIDDQTDVFIVENADIKSDLVRNGIRAKDVMTLGMPFDIDVQTPRQIADAKQELGLPKGKAVFVNISNSSRLKKVFQLLIDQGDIASFSVGCYSMKAKQELSQMAALATDVSVIFVPSKEKADGYLGVSDVAITDYDPATVYKCMKLGIPPIIISGDDHAASDIDFLVNKGLAVRAKDDLDVVSCLYAMLQTNRADEISKAECEWVGQGSLENIAGFLAQYITV